MACRVSTENLSPKDEIEVVDEQCYMRGIWMHVCMRKGRKERREGGAEMRISSHA
jgi:hypothetical protein